MIFSKEFLQEVLEDERATYTEHMYTRRWSIRYKMVFEFEGKNYQTFYSVGATEQQDERPFEYDGDEIECPEVELVEVVKKEWRVVK